MTCERWVDQLRSLSQQPLRQELAFPESAYISRISNVRQRMNDRNIDVMIVTHLQNICYLSGYQFTNSDYYGFLVLPQVGDVEMIVPATEVAAVLLHGWVRKVHEFPVWDVGVAVDLVSKVIKKYSQNKITVGVETEFELMDGQVYLNLEKALQSQSKLFDASEVVSECRMIHEVAEIGYIRQAARYSDLGMLAALSEIGVGKTENDVAARAIEDMVYVGSEYFSTAPMVTAGARSSIPNTSFRRGRVDSGEPVVIELSGNYQRYSAPLVRTGVLGKASRVARELHGNVIECLELLLSSVKPGRQIAEVGQIMKEQLAKTAGGAEPLRRFGYGLSVSMPPSWIDERLQIDEFCSFSFSSGMVFHSPIGLYIPGELGVCVGESWLVTEDGVEILSRLDRGLWEKA